MGAASKNLVRLLAATLAIILLAAALNYTVDPLQLFRAARFYPPVYSNDSRMQNAGLLRSQPFDTAFIGTSLAIHFRQSDIDRVLDVRSLKLSMPGSNSREQTFVLAAAIERGARRVIWEMDDWIFVDAPPIDADVHLPADLYRGNAKGIAQYLLSGAMARESLLILAKSIPPLDKAPAPLTEAVTPKFPVANVDDINTLARGLDVATLYNARNAKAAFAYITDPVRSAYLAEGYGLDLMARNFERDAVGLIASHPDVAFDIYFPPYSILQFVAMRDASPAALKIVTELTARISARLAPFPNVRLFDFRDVKEITHDLGNYSDVIHHSPDVDLKVLSWLANGQHVVDRAAPTASLRRLEAQVEAYRIDASP